MLAGWTDRDPSARNVLILVIYDELHRLAHHYMRSERRGHMLPDDRARQRSVLRLVDVDRMQWRDRAHFFAMAATTMRRILVDHARGQARDKRGANPIMTSLGGELAAPAPEVDVLALDEALERLAALDAQQAKVVEFRYFAGMTIEETAAALDVSPGTIKREWSVARAWLYRELRSA